MTRVGIALALVLSVVTTVSIADDVEDIPPPSERLFTFGLCTPASLDCLGRDDGAEVGEDGSYIPHGCPEILSYCETAASSCLDVGQFGIGFECLVHFYSLCTKPRILAEIDESNESEEDEQPCAEGANPSNCTTDAPVTVTVVTTTTAPVTTISTTSTTSTSTTATATDDNLPYVLDFSDPEQPPVGIGPFAFFYLARVRGAGGEE